MEGRWKPTKTLHSLLNSTDPPEWGKREKTRLPFQEVQLLPSSSLALLLCLFHFKEKTGKDNNKLNFQTQKAPLLLLLSLLRPSSTSFFWPPLSKAALQEEEKVQTSAGNPAREESGQQPDKYENNGTKKRELYTRLYKMAS